MSSKSSKVGSVLIVGGGIGGMQAALDLANSGFKTYLLEKKPAIGGVMAQLDKTFPTNDCSMCIMSPKLVDVGRHPNIELITYADLEEVKGSAGNFKVKIKKRAGYIDSDKCTGCGECEDVCPVVLESEFDEGLAERHAIYKMYPQAIPNVYTIDKVGVPPCMDTCPAHVNAQGYVALIKQGKYQEAADLIRERNPLPSVCGRICTAVCEDECNRNEIDQAVAVRALKRFALDYERNHGRKTNKENKPDKERGKGRKIAIVGGGPAGLTVGYDLAKMGYKPTVFEALSKAGGMLRYGVPRYRLPTDVLDYDIKMIEQEGVEIHRNTAVGSDLTFNDLKKQGYEAVFIAIGTHKSKGLGVDGENLEGVEQAASFLHDVSNGKKIDYTGKTVAVVGGGNVATDSVRTALRLGAKKAFIVYRRSREEIPASDEEIEDCEEEGISFYYLTSPKKIKGKNGKVNGIECIRMKLGEPDDSGRRRPIPIKGSNFTLDADAVIVAIGQEVDYNLLKADDEGLDTKKGLIQVDNTTFQTNIPWVFAAGDAVTGPGLVIDAIAQAHEAAESIDRHLNNEDLYEGRSEKEYIVAPKPEKYYEKIARSDIPKRDIDDRVNNFEEVELCLSEEEAIKEAERCLSCNFCSICKQCIDACEADAICHDMTDKDLSLDVGSVILASGYELFDAKIKSEYGYGRFPNVVNSLEFERILSASGPFQGHVVRPSDKKEPKKIAWIQCVGSRDNACGNNYCSSVCCTYAIKEAVIAKEHSPDIKPTIFYMDMRTYGKGFERYYNRAEDEHGVEFIRCRVSSIEENPETKNLFIKYETEDGKLKTEEYDMVVLSNGMSAQENMKETAKKIGVNLNEFGFCETEEFNPIETTKQGIFVCGAFSGPKDIPETVMEASGAAAKASNIIASERNKLVEKKTYPPERDVSDEDPRIGLFICHCGINIGAYVDVPKIVEYAKNLPNVAYAEENLYTCSDDTQDKIVEKIKEHKLNRVIVASCTPRTHEPLFQQTIREAGLNPHLFEMANIRDQCSWVHMKEPEKATDKAKQLVKMAVAKAALIEPLQTIEIDVTQKALVIGGGLAGIISALGIADQGFEVYLVEKEKNLGGNLRNIYWTLKDSDVQQYMKSIIEKVEKHPKIKIYKKARIEKVDGYIGNYETTIKNSSAKLSFKHGVIVVATGAEESKPSEYLYGKDKRVITQLELEKKLAEDKNFSNKTIAMIQCVGSRDEQHPYCSRICCTDAIKNALKIKEKHPDSQIYILYRDMRTYAFKESYYEKAREKGIIFIRYRKDKKPEVKKGKKDLEVKIEDIILGEELLIHTDQLVLSPAIVPREDNLELAQKLKVPLNEDNFFLEAHVKLRPVDFATEGIFLAGMAHSPKSINETIAQSHAAAARALTIISKNKYYTDAPVAYVDEDLCSGCGVCENICPYNAIEMTTEEKDGKEIRVSKVIEGVCKGCGSCVSACPSGAIEQKGFKRKQIISMIDAASE